MFDAKLFDAKLFDAKLCATGQDELQRIGEHLASCRECQDTLDTWQASFPLVGMLLGGKKASAMLIHGLEKMRKEKY